MLLQMALIADAFQVIQLRVKPVRPVKPMVGIQPFPAPAPLAFPSAQPFLPPGQITPELGVQKQPIRLLCG
jgi:hypothetical protein